VTFKFRETWLYRHYKASGGTGDERRLIKVTRYKVVTHLDVNIKLYAFYPSVLDRVECSASRFSRSTLCSLDKRLRGIQRQSGRRCKEKNLCPCRESKPDRQIRNQWPCWM